jgi:hypothetical protein
MDLLNQIETYLAQHRMPPSKFGRLAVGDPRFVDDLRGGRLPRPRTCERVHSFLANQQGAIDIGRPGLGSQLRQGDHSPA